MLIRKKLLFSTILLVGTLVLLMHSSLKGVLAYRQLTMSISALSGEFEEMWIFGQEVAELRFYFRHSDTPNTPPPIPMYLATDGRVNFISQINEVLRRLDKHVVRIKNHMESDPLLSTSEEELELAQQIEKTLKSIKADAESDYELNTIVQTAKIARQLDELGEQSQSLFEFMRDRMRSFRAQMRSSYHAWTAVILSTSVAALLIVGGSFWFIRRGVVQPFKVLLNGSRLIARGDFDHRIYLNSHDELAELAEAQNKMTDRFVEIRDNLNEKVQQRTREVVRSEQLASVGFLAAGVAHEINNPLASIAWSAEALESRLHEILHGTRPRAEAAGLNSEEQEEHEQQVEVLRKYLKRIQDEAFRCKGITERLLDFSRLGETQQKQPTDIDESVSDVIELVKHLGQFRNRTITYEGQPDVVAWVSPTEFKQVILNLLTNSLDASDAGGVVSVKLIADQQRFTLTVEDHGCGMTPEVMSHLFEPFFTRRRDGRGTGLGLSITYRIVQDHCGTLVPSSPGPGLGAKFQLTIPLLQPIDNQDHERLQAA
jgi:two-component system, NtrC family, sensor kinase